MKQFVFAKPSAVHKCMTGGWLEVSTLHSCIVLCHRLLASAPFMDIALCFVYSGRVDSYRRGLGSISGSVTKALGLYKEASYENLDGCARHLPYRHSDPYCTADIPAK